MTEKDNFTLDNPIMYDKEKIEISKSFKNDEISFKCELKNEFGFKRRLE